MKYKLLKNYSWPGGFISRWVEKPLCEWMALWPTLSEEDIKIKSDWFEEVEEPESHEELGDDGFLRNCRCCDKETNGTDKLCKNCKKCQPQEKEECKPCVFCGLPIHEDEATVNGVGHELCPDKTQQEEECKHERRCGGCNRVFYITDDVAVNCPDYPKCLPKQDCSHKNVVSWCGDCENVISPKEKERLKPSTKIINLRWQNYPDSVGEYKALEATVCAIMDFLDSVAEGKYKL